MKTIALEAKKRSITGKTVKLLRQQKLLPATIYGKGVTPESVEMPASQFLSVFQKAGETGLITLTVGDQQHPVLVKNVQRHPISGELLHVEFHQVNLKEKIRANVPVVVIGESQAVKEKVGTLLQIINEVEMEALPTDLPEHIEADISGLSNVGDHLQVKDLKVVGDAVVVSDPELLVVKIGELLAPEPEPVAAPAEGEGESAADEGKEPAGEGESQKQTTEADDSDKAPKKEG